MKQKRASVELVSEYAKQLVFEDRLNVLKNDQLYVFAKQHRKVLILQDTVDYIITDSPFVQGINYLGDDSIYDKTSLTTLMLGAHNRYPNYNILLCRVADIPYEQMGRYQNEQQANAVSNKIINFLQSHNIKFDMFFTGENDMRTIISNTMEEK